MAPRHRAYLHLGKVACPVTLACGGAHAHFGVELMNALAARLPRATVCWHDHLGHFGPMEQPGEIAAGVIAAFAG
jgi:pimeloyl-ACP methyl ester carboxylesterase